MRILVITPYARDASSFWRCMGPMGYLAKASDGEIAIDCPQPNTQLAWDGLMKYDAVFFHRPCRRDDLTIMQVARNANIPVWIDYDDWLFDLPAWNPHQPAYSNPTMQLMMAHMLACADVVTCTTDALAKKFSQVNDQVVIVPNAYRSDLFPWRTATPPERKNTFFWRGTNTHDGDLLSVKEGYKHLWDKLHVFGQLPYTILQELDASQYNLIPHQDVLIYWQKIYELAPKFLVLPLDDHFFNHCKSNIAWIEACHAGAMTIGPDMPEWRQPGVISFKPNDVESFKSALELASKLTPDQFTEQAKLSYEHMRKKYDITVVNQIRIKILEAMRTPSFKKNTRSPYDQSIALWSMAALKGQKK